MTEGSTEGFFLLAGRPLTKGLTEGLGSAFWDLFRFGWAMVLGGGWCLKKGGGEVLRYQGGAVVSALVRVCGIESRRLVWLVLSLLAARGSHVLPVGAVVLLGCR